MERIKQKLREQRKLRMKTILSHGKWQTQKNFGLTWHIKKNVYSLLMVQPCLTDFVFSPCVLPPSIVVCSVQCVLVLTLLQLQQSAIEKPIKIYPKTNFWAGQDISQKSFLFKKICISVLWGGPIKCFPFRCHRKLVEGKAFRGVGMNVAWDRCVTLCKASQGF